MIYTAKGPLVLTIAFTFFLQAYAQSQPVTWRMEAQNLDQKPLGEIRSPQPLRLQPLSNDRPIQNRKPAFSTERPPVIEIGPLRDRRPLLEHRSRPAK